MVEGSVLLHEQDNVLDVLQRPGCSGRGGQSGKGRRISVDGAHTTTVTPVNTWTGSSVSP